MINKFKLKIKCNKCGYIKETFESEDLYGGCPICGSKDLEILNLDEYYKWAYENRRIKYVINNFKTEGIEKTIELIEGNEFLKNAYKDVINKIFNRKMI